MSLRTLLLSGLGLALAAAACTVTPRTDNAATDNAATYGVVADPPLPTSVPVVPLSGPDVLANHDGSVVVALDHSSPGASALVFQTGTGAAVESTKIVVDAGAKAELRAVSADGSMAAAFEQVGEAADLTSRITVIDRSASSGAESAPVQSVYELPGLIEPEAFSTDGGQLFVIDHTVDGGPDAYRVRPFDLATGQLQNILGPTKVPFDDAMNGVGRRQVWSPDADRLYTLYIRQTHHHHDELPEGFLQEQDGGQHGHPEPGTDGFVHVLDLREEWAFCLDLPPSFGGGDLATTALAVSPDGETVAVADLHAQAVAFASTTDLTVTETRPLPEIAANGEVHLGLSSSNALFLASGTQGQWYDAETMTKLTTNPTQFKVPVRGLTSLFNGLLVWSTDLELAPTELDAPR